MTRLVLSLSVSSAVLFVGLTTTWVQSSNFAHAAELHQLQRDSDGYVRRAIWLRNQIERMEFDLLVQQNLASERPAKIAVEGRD